MAKNVEFEYDFGDRVQLRGDNAKTMGPGIVSARMEDGPGLLLYHVRFAGVMVGLDGKIPHTWLLSSEIEPAAE